MDQIDELNTATLSGTLEDEHGAAINGAAITSLHVTLRLAATGEIINSRYSIDLFVGGTWPTVNGMKITPTNDSTGLITLKLDPLDNAIIGQSTDDAEIHTVWIQVTTAASTINKPIEYEVKNNGLRNALGIGRLSHGMELVEA